MTDPGPFDEDVLETVVARRRVLETLAAGPYHRQELQEAVDVSKTTCHRIVRALDERDLLRRTDRGYELSVLGERVTESLLDFEAGVRRAYELEPLLEAFEHAPVDLDLDLFTDATITRPRPEDPSPPVNRYLELFKEAKAVRTLDRTSFVPPLYVEEIIESARDRGAKGVAIYPKSVVETRFSRYEDLHRAAAEADASIRYRVHDEVPFGMTIYDEERVGLRAYDDATGALRLYADTDDPDAVDWALDVFERYYEESDPAAAVEDLPDWIPGSKLQF